MELLKKNIHTEQIKSKALLQIPLEEDINVSDSKPDVARVIYYCGKIKIDEIKTGMNKAWVKGRLCYQILYQAEGADSGISSMEGEIPFTEEIYLENLDSQDRVICKADLEDMKVNIINSRKLSIQAVISLDPKAEETVSDELCIGLEDSGSMADMKLDSSQLEYRKKNLDYLETVVKKRDLLRIHEEARLPAGMPDIGELLWKSMDIASVKFRAMDEKLAVNGEMNVFIIYKEDSSDKINWYQTQVPFSGNIECQNSHDGMIADVLYDIGHEEITIRDDTDGEPRIIGIEAALELEIKLYEKEHTSIAADVYGVSCDVKAVTEDKKFKDLFAELNIEEKLLKDIKIEDTEPGILQVCHCDEKVSTEDIVFNENGISLNGNVEIRMLYSSNDESKIFCPITETVPFDITQEIPGLDRIEVEQCTILPQLSQQTISIKDSHQIEWRAVLNLRVLIYSCKKEAILTDIKVSQIDDDVIEKLPGFTIYFVKPNDSLWQIGKKYYVSVERIKEINNLTSDEIKPGDRLLIVK